MRNTQIKSINQSEVFIGGMYFENNNISLNLNDGLDYVNIIGNFHSVTINSCFLTVNNSLTLLRNKRIDRLQLKWEFISESKENLAISFRVRRQDSKGNFGIIDSTRVNSSSNSETFGQTIIDVNSGDKFYMQLRNIDLLNPTSNILIPSARLILEQ